MKEKTVPPIPHLRPADPKDTALWEVAVHEAAHAVLFCYAGTDRIALSLRASYLLQRGEMPLSFLPAAYGGYAADIEINRLPVRKALQRTQRDRGHIAHIASQEPDTARRTKLCVDRLELVGG